jgi:hypothetical protein
MKSFATILVYCLFYFRSSRNWSEEEREQLIEAVKNYPCLYDTTCKIYKEITVKPMRRWKYQNFLKVAAQKMSQCNGEFWWTSSEEQENMNAET